MGEPLLWPDRDLSDDSTSAYCLARALGAASLLAARGHYLTQVMATSRLRGCCPAPCKRFTDKIVRMIDYRACGQSLDTCRAQLTPADTQTPPTSFINRTT